MTEFACLPCLAARRLFAAVAFVTLACCGWAHATSTDNRDCVVSIGWLDFKPYVFADPTTGAPTGVDFEIFEATLAQLGCAAEWREMPWARLLHEIEIGAVQAAPYAVRTTDREQFARFSSPYLCNSFGVWTNADSRLPRAFQRLRDLREIDLSIGVVREAVYSPDYARLLKDPTFTDRLHRVTATEKLTELLRARRVDGIIRRDLAMQFHLRSDSGHGDDFVRADIGFDAVPLGHFMFGREQTDAAFVKRFDEALTAIVASARFDRIVETYGGDPSALRPHSGRQNPCAGGNPLG